MANIMANSKGRYINHTTNQTAIHQLYQRQGASPSSLGAKNHYNHHKYNHGIQQNYFPIPSFQRAVCKPMDLLSKIMIMTFVMMMTIITITLKLITITITIILAACSFFKTITESAASQMRLHRKKLMTDHLSWSRLLNASLHDHVGKSYNWKHSHHFLTFNWCYPKPQIEIDNDEVTFGEIITL